MALSTWQGGVLNTYFHLIIYLITYLVTYLLTYSMEQSPSWEAKRFSASQEFSRILWIPKVHYRLYNSLPPDPILSQINLVRASHPTTWRYILILSSHLCLDLPSRFFPSGFPTKTLYTPLFSPYVLHAPAHLILLDFITRRVLGKENRLLS